MGATDTYDGRSVALADLWNRGVLDVVVANQRGPLLIYKNTVKPGERVDRVFARRNEEQPQRDRRAGHSVLERAAAVAAGLRRKRICRAERPPAHFGLGKNPQIEKAVIRWPSGKVQTIENLVPGKLYNVKEAE